MPSASKKQHNFMNAIANNPEFAKKVGVKQSVGKDFSEADKGKKFKTGGVAAEINKPKTHHTDGGVPNNSTRKFMGLKGGGMATKKLFGGKESFKEELGEAKAIKSGKLSPMQYAKGEESEKPMKKMAAGGVVKKLPTSKQMGNLGMKAGGKVKEARMEPAKMGKVPRRDAGPAKKEARMEPASMGRVKTSSSKDGIASKGRTKTKYC